MIASDVHQYTRRCVACGAVFNVLSGHAVSVCAAVLTDRKPPV